MNDSLKPLRENLDRIDNELMLLLAERFRVTAKVGQLKRDNNMPSKDPARELEQFARLEKLAKEVGLDPAFARALWRRIIDEVIKNHVSMRERTNA